MSTFSWTFSGLNTNGSPWTAFEYWLLYVDGAAHSALPRGAVTPAYAPGASALYTCDLTKLDPIASAAGSPSQISAGPHTFAVAAVGGGISGAPGPTTSVTYIPPTAVVTAPAQPPVPATPAAAVAIPT